MMSFTHRRLKRGIVLVVSLAIAYTLNFFLTPLLVGERLELYFRPHFGSKFDSEVWRLTGPKSWKPGGPHYGSRYEMVDDLLGSGRVVGMAEDSLLTMLGTPELADSKAGEKRLFYVLGDQRTYPARSIWFPGWFANLDRWMLQVELRDGKACSARVFFD
jgi:hypothetical protein